jgi:hypothetical protein
MIRFLRHFWLTVFMTVGGPGVGLALAVVSGTPRIPFAVTGYLAGVLVSGVMTFRPVTRDAREAALRRITGRRRPDYELIARLERECGIGPGEPLRQGTGTLTANGAPAATAALAGTGSLTAAVHLAGLARVGRESCVTYCPICAARREATAHDRYGHPYDRGSVVSYVRDVQQQWLETERREQQ